VKEVDTEAGPWQVYGGILVGSLAQYEPGQSLSVRQHSSPQAWHTPFWQYDDGQSASFLQCATPPNIASVREVTKASPLVFNVTFRAVDAQYRRLVTPSGHCSTTLVFSTKP